MNDKGETIECEECNWTTDSGDRWDLVEHTQAHLPVPGQLFFVAKAHLTRSNFGSGRPVYDITDNKGRWLGQLDSLPKETAFIEKTTRGTQGMLTPVVWAYDPENVEVA